MDFSKLSDDDLKALASQDLSKVSDDGLRLLASSQQPQQPEPEKSAVVDYLKNTANNMKQTYGMIGRAGIEGLAGIPENIYNLGATVAGKEPVHYGKQLADYLRLPDSEGIPMEIAKAVAGGGLAGAGLKAAGALPKVAKMLGADKPIRAAIGTAGGVGASGVAQEMTQDSNDPLVKYGVPLVAGVAGNAAAGGLAKAGMYMASPTERAAGALQRQEKKIAQAQQRLPDDLTTELQPYGAQLYEGVKPTAAMIYKNPAIGSAETMARLRNKEAFNTRDTENAKLIALALRDKANAGDAKTMLSTLNAQTTPLRESAENAAKLAGGFDAPIRQKIDDFLTGEGTRGLSSTESLTKSLQKALNYPDVSPADLYSRRKELADALKDKSPLTMDEMTNAAKNNRRLASSLKDSIDKGLNQASGGKWGEYLKTHREGMKPINDLEAWQQIQRKFENAPEIEQGIPRITPAALRRAVNSESNSASGRDLLLPQSREDAVKMVQTMNSIERAKDAKAAISGSQTTPLAMQAMQSMIPDKAKPFTSVLGGLKDFATGNSALDDALLNPEKLPALIDMAIKNKDETLLNALRNAVVRQSTLNQQVQQGAQ